jgi:hypothetical protein
VHLDVRAPAQEGSLDLKSSNDTYTIAALLAKPEALVSVGHLIEANVVTSGQAAARWVRHGWLPRPIKLPNGQLRWIAGAVVKTAGLEQAAE